MTVEAESGAAPAQAGAEPQVEVAVEAAAPEARVAELEAELARARADVEQATARLQDERDRHLRAAADLENVRKRAQRERDELQKFGAERLLKDLLPVVDNLDRALAAAGDGDPLGQGVRLVRKGLEEALARHGVEVFSALGAPFDPRLHEALAQLDAPHAEPGSVVAEHGRGFLLHDRLLRPALVAVAIAQPREAAAAEAQSVGEAEPAGDASQGEPRAPRRD